jgi:hypothetical protein
MLRPLGQGSAKGSVGGSGREDARSMQGQVLGGLWAAARSEDEEVYERRTRQHTADLRFVGCSVFLAAC